MDYYCSEHYSKVKEDKINNEKSTENKEGCWCSKNECWCCRYRSELCCEDKKKYVIAKCDYCIKTVEKKNIVCLIHKQHTKYSIRRNYKMKTIQDMIKDLTGVTVEQEKSVNI
ncbi:hypothetical protein [Spiroplasma citri]|uniref:hypothetical protein n=1 Tax=Spiroplasma citri TaxID=2133 RepID=UPI0011BB8BE8|nr:hypothetical protein [Spiroplasma citri]QED24653.1 hypothetical protein FRX96_04225 [Spiroplasma citri]